MEPSYRIVPAAKPKSAAVQDTAGTFGLHDTLKYGPRTIEAEVNTESGLKARLEHWEETQDNAQLTFQRHAFGLHVPMRLMMERKIVSSSVPLITAAMAGSRSPPNLHLDILMGRDESIEPVDVFLGMENGPSLDILEELTKHRM